MYKVNNMKTLLEQMKQYAGVIEEDYDIKGVGRKLEMLSNQGFSQTDLNKKLDTFAKDWIKLSKVGKVIQLSLFPKDYNANEGNIDDVLASDCKDKIKIKKIFRAWIPIMINRIKKENPGFNVILQGKEG